MKNTIRATGFLGRAKTLILVGIAAAAAGLGGCNKEKQLQAENDQLRSEVEGLQQANQQLTAQNQQLLAEIANRQAAPAPAIDYPSGGGRRSGGADNSVARLTVAGDVLFASGSDTLSAGGKRELDKIASTIKRQYAGNSIRIEGYTDSDPIKKSKWPSNQALSAARASAVERYLISRGISGSLMEAVGMGSANAKATKAASRRVEIVILG